MTNSEDAKDGQRSQGFRMNSSPIELQTENYGTVLIRPIWTGDDYARVRQAINASKDDSLSAARQILKILQSSKGEPPVDFESIPRREIETLLAAYMNEKRTRLTPARLGVDVTLDFVTQIESVVERYENLLREAISNEPHSMKKLRNSGLLYSIDPAALFPPISFNLMPLTATALDAIQRRSGQFAALATPPSSSIDLVSAAAGMSLSDLAESIKSPMQKLVDTSTTLTDSMCGLWLGEQTLSQFTDLSSGYWSGFEELIEQLEERIKRDETLRSMGIDVDRLNVTGAFDWLIKVSDAIDKAGDDEEATKALIAYANSEVVRLEIDQLVTELPEDTRAIRIEAINQALEAHDRGHYYASCTLLIAQIDGILGDILVELQRQNGAGENRLTGLRARIRDLDSFVDPNNQFPSVINAENDFIDPRNRIAHGDPEGDFSERQSAKQIFLLLSLLCVHLDRNDVSESGTKEDQ